MPNPGLTFRTIGGMLEFFIFLGPTPENVVQQYTDVIGRTFLPPYWSLGFQISRWGYHNTDDITAVLDRTKKANIPQVINIGRISLFGKGVFMFARHFLAEMCTDFDRI